MGCGTLRHGTAKHPPQDSLLSAAYRHSPGDIVITEKDVFGDGVNIASRIQALCEPGGILISATVYHDVRNKTGITADCLGEKILKNIDEPVKIYSISTECIQKIPEQSSKESQSRQGNIGLRTSQGIWAPKTCHRSCSYSDSGYYPHRGYFIVSKNRELPPGMKRARH